jgi:hypothetical protein
MQFAVHKKLVLVSLDNNLKNQTFGFVHKCNTKKLKGHLTAILSEYFAPSLDLLHITKIIY